MGASIAGRYQKINGKCTTERAEWRDGWTHGSGNVGEKVFQSSR